MGRIKRKLIEYNGICGKIKDLDLFKQENENFMLYIDEEKEVCKEIEKIWIDYKIIKTKKIKTHRGISIEGVKLTGIALMILGDFQIKIQYMGNGELQNIYNGDFIVPFSGVVNLPSGFNENQYVVASVYIEDIDCHLISSRKLYFNVTYTLNATMY